MSISAFCGCLLIANDVINITRNIKEHNEIDKGVVRFSRVDNKRLRINMLIKAKIVKT